MKVELIALMISVEIMHSCNLKEHEVHYHENGDTLSICMLNNGLKHGTFRVYYENGSLHQFGNFKYGLKDGIFNTFSKNGQLLEYFVYMNDTLIYLKEFDHQGTIVNSILGIKSPITLRANEDYFVGDTILIGYSLTHTMYDRPLIGIEVTKINKDLSTKLIFSDIERSNNITYNLTELDEGRNKFVITIIELNPLDTTISGYVTDTISFKASKRE